MKENQKGCGEYVEGAILPLLLSVLSELEDTSRAITQFDGVMVFADEAQSSSASLTYITEQFDLVAAADVSFVEFCDISGEELDRSWFLVLEHGEVRRQKYHWPKYVLFPVATLDAGIEIVQNFADAVMQELRCVSVVGDGGPV
jgi:hypothetical protein